MQRRLPLPTKEMLQVRHSSLPGGRIAGRCIRLSLKSASDIDGDKVQKSGMPIESFLLLYGVVDACSVGFAFVVAWTSIVSSKKVDSVDLSVIVG